MQQLIHECTWDEKTGRLLTKLDRELDDILKTGENLVAFQLVGIVVCHLHILYVDMVLDLQFFLVQSPHISWDKL